MELLFCMCGSHEKKVVCISFEFNSCINDYVCTSAALLLYYAHFFFEKIFNIDNDQLGYADEVARQQQQR